ncbi:tRNA pseudouridine(13) synthase TruD [Methylomonas sp. SURF-2]|uniref:tRNA pseudouridine synthase D n=1 Tax=Methylomonas subterranea TaxID=2952225 RepID=A0ABT1TH46_9GAMM|nr:tRNA pseudouridine(13) synthase TruD [Methylomonas sp. SURF-2]
MSDFSIPVWPHAYGGPVATGDIKAEPEDFVVEEILSFIPEGSGEHVFLHIEKIGENTEYVARLLARHAGVRQRDIGYAGLKDRHGRTRQWFSVWLPTPKQALGPDQQPLPGKPEPDWRALENTQLKILQVIRHARKLRRGVLSGNRFEIVLRNWQGNREVAEQQLRQIQTQGFPNYFGEQRFGHQGRNVEKALAMFAGDRVKREQRSIYLSAARSFLFNQILAERLYTGTWNCGLAGEVCKLQGSNSQFVAASIDQTLMERMRQGETHPTGALWGKGICAAGGEVLALEQRIVSRYPSLADGLLKAELEQDRRALRVIPEDLNWQFEKDSLLLRFGLPAGSYATALLREIVQTSG